MCHQTLKGGSGPDLVWQAETRSSQKQSIINQLNIQRAVLYSVLVYTAFSAKCKEGLVNPHRELPVLLNIAIVCIQNSSS